MMVAGFELTRTTSKPSSRSALAAWVPEWSNSQAWPRTMGPEPIRRIFLRSVRFGTLCLALDLAVDDGGFGNRLLALVEHVVDAPRAEPHRLAVAPELLPEHAHALLHALLDGMGLQ